jgi:hypothetical protein
MAANMVAVAYQQDARYAEALDWAQRSMALLPTDGVKGLIAQLTPLAKP